MKKFEGILFCTDLDGTLLRSDKTLSKRNLEAIEYFKSEGGLFTFITGRMPCTALNLYNTVKPNAPIGCINGGGIFDYEKETYVYKNGLNRSATELVKYINEAIPEIGFQVNTFDKIYFTRDSSAMERFREATGYPDYRKDLDDITEPLAKILLGDEDEKRLMRAAKLLSEHPLAENYDFVRSEKILYEILPKGNSKGRILPILCEHLGIDPERSVAAGDYDNDVSMLKAADVGVAVANATEGVKKAADYITVSNDEDAIAVIISDIENGKIKV